MRHKNKSISRQRSPLHTQTHTRARTFPACLSVLIISVGLTNLVFGADEKEMETIQAQHVLRTCDTRSRKRRGGRHENTALVTKAHALRFHLEEKKQIFGLHLRCLPLLRWGLIISQLKET